MRTEVLGVGASQLCREEAFSAKSVEVARDRVVEGEQRSKDAGNEQQRHHCGQRPSDVGRAEREQERGRVRLEASEVFLQPSRTLALDHEVRGERVEDADGQDGNVGCPRDSALGALASSL